ncbi:7tm 6 domain containing protein [Asbolus verrucosus]|uniref:7tm 6 domain containing protein n=1 Tax=Asbolus verrucosus TaxID=1661398 RepID=A0A482V6H7_ASBVE|nr:7tm 6 domain containing protein [Asbolus verrucosus]
MFMIAVTPVVLLWAAFPVLNESYRDYRLPFSAWYPLSTDTSPAYEIIYFHQVMGIFIAGIATVNIDMLISALLMYIGAQYDILCDYLKNLGHFNADDYEKHLIKAIKHHKEILRYYISS